MTVEDQIGYLQSKIASLEAKLASLESRGEDPITEGRLYTTPQPAVDPKGRKIWDAEWRGDYKVMMAYVPDNALIIDGQNVAVEADDKEGSEVTLSDGSWYLHAYKNKTTGNWEAELDQEPTGTREDEEAKYNIHICDIHEDGYIEKQYVVGSIVIGGECSKFVGDYDGSEKINGEDGAILVTGHPGGMPQEETPPEQDSHSGLQFLTVGARKDEESGEKIPPKIVARIKGKAQDEDWSAKTMTVTPAEGSPKTVHFLGSDNIDIEIPAPVDPPDPLEGSDYIDVPTQGQDAGKILAKVDTPDPQSDLNTSNALLTHNTNQFVRCVKTFLGYGAQLASALKRVIIDGPNGKIEAIAPSGGEEYKIVIDAGELAAANPECEKKEIHVKKLTVTHPRAKTVDGQQVTSETYHVLSCDDIDIHEGDAIQRITSGTTTQSGGFTITPVTIWVKDGTATGTALDAFNISAKNGADGDDGDDGASVVSATAGTPVVSGNTTTTPITFTLSDGTTVGPVWVTSTNGVAASGSDYIDVGDGTGGTTKGQVSAKTTGTKHLITNDTAQTIGGSKTFSKTITVTNDQGTAYYNPNAIHLKAQAGNPYLAFYDSKDASTSVASIQLSNSTGDAHGRLWINDGKNGVVVNAPTNKFFLNTATTDNSSTALKAIPSMGWVNDKFLRIENLVAGSNITITPDTTNPKKLTIAATGGAPLDHSFSWEGTKKADIAASENIAIDSKTIQGSGDIEVTETNRNITISYTGPEISGYTTPEGTDDYEVTGLEWDSSNHRLVIHRVEKTYEDGILITRESATDEYIQFVEETV